MLILAIAPVFGVNKGVEVAKLKFDCSAQPMAANYRGMSANDLQSMVDGALMIVG